MTAGVVGAARFPLTPTIKATIGHLMTLVVARQTGNIISAVSDTAITFNNAVLPISKSIPKIAIFGTNLAIGFAGSTDLSREAFADFRLAGLLDAISIKQFFLDKHNKSNKMVDFILMFNSPARIVTIKDGRITRVIGRWAWIGRHEAFTAFQWHFRYPVSFLPPFERTTIVSQQPQVDATMFALVSTLRRVILDRKVPTVGGFKVAVNNNTGMFQFKNYAAVLDTDREILRNVLSSEFVREDYEEQLNYAESCFVSLPSSSVMAIAFHYMRGRLTYLFRDGGLGLLDQAEVFTDKTFQEFEKLTGESYGITWDAFIFSRRGPPSADIDPDPRWRAIRLARPPGL